MPRGQTGENRRENNLVSIGGDGCSGPPLPIITLYGPDSDKRPFAHYGLRRGIRGRFVATNASLLFTPPIISLTRADALRLRSHWQDRVVAGEVQIGTANKCIGHVSTMFRAITLSNVVLESPTVLINVP